MLRQEKAVVETPSPEEISFHADAPANQGLFLDPLIILAKRKRFVLWFVGAAALLSIAICMVLPKSYTATTKILPPKENTSIATAMLGQLGPLIGAAAGKDLGIHNPNDMYVAMLRSRTVSDDLIDRFTLMKVYGKKLRVDARKKLDNLTEIDAGRDDVITVSVEDRDPNRAAQIANSYIDELGDLTKTLAVTDASKRRLFFEREVKAASVELAQAEDAMKATQQSTGIIQLDSQAKVMFEGLAELRAKVSAKQVEVQAMKSFATDDNPDLIRAEEELTALRGQVARLEKGQDSGSAADIPLEKVPAAGLEYLRKLREVKYRETLLELLTKQYEIARIDEAKDAAIVQVLDKAVPPEKRSWPPRTAIVLACTLLALLIAISITFLMEWIQKAKEDPQLSARLHLLKFYLQNNRKP